MNAQGLRRILVIVPGSCDLCGPLFERSAFHRPRSAKMSVRVLQTVCAAGNCVFGLMLLALYGPALMHSRVWPLSLDQQVLILVAGSAFPLAVLAVRFPLVGGMAQFCAAYLGNQLLHEAPLHRLRELSSASMMIALAILFVAVLRGILEITQEAFGEAEEADEQRAVSAA